ERTVYRITRQGDREMITWLQQLLEQPAADPMWFYAALSFLPALEPQDVLKRLQRRMQALETDIQTYKQLLTSLTPRIGRLSLVEVEYALALRVAEARWVAEIINDLKSKKLNWDRALVRKYANQFFTTAITGNSNGNSNRLPTKRRIKPSLGDAVNPKS